MKESKRNYIDKDGVKIFVTDGEYHREIDFDYHRMDGFRKRGWSVYAINKEGIFFYLANCDLDGKDWCKITKE